MRQTAGAKPRLQKGLTSREKAILSVAMGCLIALNLVTFVLAYPETSVIDSGCCSNKPLAKDFSAYYTAAWRLFDEPSQVYNSVGLNQGGYHGPPEPESYKYLPSFLFMVAPFLLLGYHQALIAFDVFQILLLPLIALLLFTLFRRKGLGTILLVEAIVLVFPLPWPNWGLSVPYYWQWAEGQSKVLETFLILLAFYLGTRRMPKLSGIVFALTAFDPRFTLVGLPLFLAYNRSNLKIASLAATGAFLLSNIALFYPGVGSGFLSVLLNSGLTTPLYYYALIPLAAIVALTVLEAREIARTFEQIIGRGARVKS